MLTGPVSIGSSTVQYMTPPVSSISFYNNLSSTRQLSHCNKMSDSAAKPKKAPPAHPTYAVMVAAAVKALKDRTGSSRQAILKYIMANYKVGDDAKKVGVHLKLALKKAVAAGALKMAKESGKGAGCYKIGEKAKEEKKPKKKPAAKKTPKKPAKKPKTPKKAAKPKKTVKPKETAKPKKTVKPKKAAKPKKAEKPKKTKTPKKQAKKTAPKKK